MRQCIRVKHFWWLTEMWLSIFRCMVFATMNYLMTKAEIHIKLWWWWWRLQKLIFKMVQNRRCVFAATSKSGDCDFWDFWSSNFWFCFERSHVSPHKLLLSRIRCRILTQCKFSNLLDVRIKGNVLWLCDCWGGKIIYGLAKLWQDYIWSCKTVNTNHPFMAPRLLFVVF